MEDINKRCIRKLQYICKFFVVDSKSCFSDVSHHIWKKNI